MSRSPRPTGLFVFVLAGLFFRPGEAASYTHIAGPGESLAEIADEAYGDPAKESLLAIQNALDLAGGAAIVAGMHIEVPAPIYVRARQGDTWAVLSRTYLGDPRRADWLARENHSKSWVPPTPGQEVRVFATVSHIAKEGDDMVSIARRHYGEASWSWKLNNYNFREGTKVDPGDVILLPMPDLELVNGAQARTQGAGVADGTAVSTDFRAQRRAEAEMPALLLDAARGRYVDVIARGNRLLGRNHGADLSDPQRARIFEQLTEAYVAEGIVGQARAACEKWAGALGHPPH
jgi:hypothetical protein